MWWRWSSCPRSAGMSSLPGRRSTKTRSWLQAVLLKDAGKRVASKYGGGEKNTDYITRRDLQFSKSLDFLAENGQFLMLKKSRDS